MATTQDGRLLAITTPLEKDFLLINSFEAIEGISQLFSIEAELVHCDEVEDRIPKIVDPKDLLGNGVTIGVVAPDGVSREFSGIVNSFTQGIRNRRFTFYEITIVPRIWIMTKKVQSQIFQQKSVPDILKKMFQGFEVKYDFREEYEPRNYCVQYRESDFAFVSRLMEEEGIFYYFVHADGIDKLVVTDSALSHPVCPTRDTIPFFTLEEQKGFESWIRKFDKAYRLRSGKVTLWDHTFQLPGKSLEREEVSQYTYGDNKNYEYYDYPAGYARKFDGISSGGGDQDSELNKVFPDRDRVTKRWMEGIDAEVEEFSGRGDCCSLTAGHKFTHKGHPNKAFDKQYVVTSAQHSAQQSPTYLADKPVEQPYVNMFTCIGVGSGLPCFRPQRATPKPVVHGSQTAYVVGPSGEEIHVDKYGRVKVQFHWDRDSEANENSSCWIPVAQMWAGNKWGGIFIPRIGMEVIVHFLEGDADQPIISGCIYNPGAMPPYTLPDEKTKSTLKSNSSKGGKGFNEFRFEDKKGDEEIFIHAEKNLEIRVKNDRHEWIKRDRHLRVLRDKREWVYQDKHIKIDRDQKELIRRDKYLKIEGKEATQVSGSLSLKVDGAVAEKFGADHAEDTSGTIYLKAGTSVIIEAGTQITLKAGSNFIDIGPGGISIVGSPFVNINSGGAAGTGSPGSIVPPEKPDDSEEAVKAEPGSASETYKRQRRQIPPSKQPTYTQPSHKPDSPANEEKKSWIEIVLKDEDGVPVPGEKYRVTLPDGSTLAEGTLDQNGYAKVSNIDPGNCKVTFPNQDFRSWKKV